MSVTETHEEKETLAIDVSLPGHEARVSTELFVRTRREVLTELDNRCEVSGAPATEVGPIELHHFWVERCEAEKVDPFRLHHWISLVHQKASAALAWFEGQLSAGKGYTEIWADPYSFTDDMHANGLALCKRLHIGKGEGIHAMPFPLWQFWATGRAGFRFVGQDAVVDEELSGGSGVSGHEGSLRDAVMSATSSPPYAVETGAGAGEGASSGVSGSPGGQAGLRPPVGEAVAS